MKTGGSHARLCDASPPVIAVLAGDGDAGNYDQAAQLAQELRLPFVDEQGGGAFDLLLVCTNERLELRDNRNPRLRPVFADLDTTGLFPADRDRHQPLVRAIGRNAYTLVDATAGLGQDTCLLARLGYSVTAIERCPIVAALLKDAWQRSGAGALGSDAAHTGIRVIAGDARTVLPGIHPVPDVVYLDPMFPPKKKSALPKKELRLLRELVGNDPDAAELLTVSRRVAVQRVVVKRSLSAPPLSPRPDASYHGKLVRYDMYLPVPGSPRH